MNIKKAKDIAYDVETSNLIDNEVREEKWALVEDIIEELESLKYKSKQPLLAIKELVEELKRGHI